MILPSDKHLELKVLAICINAEMLFPSISESLFFWDESLRVYRMLKSGIFSPTPTQRKNYKIDMESWMDLIEASASSQEPTTEIECLRVLYGRREAIKEAHKVISICEDNNSESYPISIINENYISSREQQREIALKHFEQKRTLDCGFKVLDQAIQTFERGHVWILAGRSGTGKTGLGMQLLRNIAKSTGGKGLFFSIEMTEQAVIDRLATQVYYERFGYFWDDETAEEQIKECRNWVQTNYKSELESFLPDFEICTKPALTLDDIRGYVRKVKADVVLIDYLGLMKAEAGDRRNEVSIIARGLKEVAKDENIRIICLSQLSRLAEDGTQPVKLHHLKESGDIEESADIVTGQWKSKSKKVQNIATLKLRNGGFEGQFKLITDGTYFRTPTAQEINLYGAY